MEVLLAAFVVAIGVLPAIAFLVSSGSALKQSTPYYQAVFLGELAVEELRLAAYEDPHYIGQLMSGQGTARASVLKGGHEFTRVLEDSRPPFGRMEPGKDWGIEPAVGPLFGLAEPLAMALSPAVDPDGTRVEVTLDWIDNRGQAMEYGLPTPLKAWVPLPRVETVPPAPPPTGAVAALQVLASLARAARTASATLEAQAGSIPVPAPGPEPAVRGLALLRKALIHEAATAVVLGHLQAMKAPILELANGDNGPLAGIALGAREAALDDCKLVLEAYARELANTIDLASQAGREPGLSMGQALQAHRVVHRAALLDGVTRPWPSLAPLSDYLVKLQEYYRDRMPHVAHALEAERGVLSDVAGRYPLAPAARDVVELRQNFTRAAIRVLLAGAAS